MNSRMLPRVTLQQFYKYLGRYVRQNPVSARVIPPTKRFQASTEPGVGVFFYPPDEWTKTKAFAVGPLGQTEEKIHPSKFQISRRIAVPEEDSIPEVLYWGTGGAVRVTKNLTSGVSEGFAVNLELHGVGYRAEADEKANKLTLRTGFSHTIELPLNDGEVFFNVINPQLIQVAGLNRGKVHQRAAKVRALRPPEPYKGKGRTSYWETWNRGPLDAMKAPSGVALEWNMNHIVFTYGTLLSEEVLRTVIGRIPERIDASLRGYSRATIRGRRYPAVYKANDSNVVAGKALLELTEKEFEILDKFEDPAYNRVFAAVEVANGTLCNARIWAWPEGNAADLILGVDWDYERFQELYGEEYIKLCSKWAVDNGLNSP